LGWNPGNDKEFFLIDDLIKEFSLEKIISAVIFVGGILLSGLTFALPFIFNFENIAKGVDFVNARTPIWQLGVLWGFPALLTFIFIFLLFKNKKIRNPDLFIISLLVTSWLLIFLPEIIYVKDIYIASHHRANTMFKLTYQAFVMFYVSAGFIAAKSLLSTQGIIKKLGVTVFFGILFASILWYPSFAIKSYYGDLKDYKGLSGDSWLKTQRPNVYDAISWLKKNVTGQPTILEAPGDSYTEFNVISSYTGLPTVLGWFVHEWLWRGEASFPQSRVNDITQIYISPNLDLTKKLLNKYKVKYVIVGEFEREKYPTLLENKFENLGKLVFTSGDLKIYEIN